MIGNTTIYKQDVLTNSQEVAHLEERMATHSRL